MKRETPVERKARARKIIRLLERAYPDARIALTFSDPLELLVATILSAQCTDERVNQVTPALFKKYRTAAEWARLTPPTLEPQIRSTGFYRAKARSIIGMANALVAEHGSAWILPRLVGMANACDLLFSGRLVGAEEALAMGLVNRVVPHDALLAHVREYARELATQCSPRALRIMKRQLWADQFGDLGASIRVADAEMLASFGSEDFREGIASFVERRPPRFTGR